MKSIELNLTHLTNPNYGKIPEESNEGILKLADPHIDSFDFCMDEGLNAAIDNILPLEFSTTNGEKITLLYQNFTIGNPKISLASGEVVDLNLYPKECIESGSTYKASMRVSIGWSVNGTMESPISHNIGEIPIMLKSSKCNLRNMKPEELVKHGELVNETGGYFIVNGNCRVLRLLIANRRNYPLAMIRKTWKNRDSNYSEKGILIRCVGKDQTNSVNVLHHLTTGGVKIEFQMSREIFFVPLIMALKVLSGYSDRLIYLSLIKGREKNNYFIEKVKMMLRELQDCKQYNQKMCKEYIGMTFRTKISNILPPWTSNEEICDFLFNNYVLTHLDSPLLKFETLCMMTRKLYSFVDGECAAESVDCMSMQETTLGGHTYLQLLKEKLKQALLTIKFFIIMKNQKKGENYHVNESDMRMAVTKISKIGESMQTFIATGSLPLNINCGLMQTTGLTVMVDHLNRMRDMSHLRAIHRGAYFLDMKTVAPRRLTGEAWGFICPVHTPDGAPCGLLNHLAYNCVIPCNNSDASVKLLHSIHELGMTLSDSVPCKPYDQCLEVVVDGAFVGYITKDTAEYFEHQIRYLKVIGKIYKYTEIVLIMERECCGQYPGLFIFTSESRMMRPVYNLTLGEKEYIGTFEQNYLNIAISPEDIDPKVHSHLEMDKGTMFSNIGKLVPFSDCNPNPRNMYQCQMGKQTMGTPLHNWRNQTFSKLYRLQYPQVPLIRNAHYDKINMDEFCMGFNAVVAIISYTGYDMEDAMVINKCSMERGLAHGQVYKSEFVDLTQLKKDGHKSGSEVNFIFKRDPQNLKLEEFLDLFGLPYPGTKLTAGDSYYCYYDVHQLNYHVVKYKGEDCVVDKYSIINLATAKTNELQRVNISIRIRRDPIIGDKFASRSGQKGVMSRLYPMEDMPFSERGITPDIIFNPHGIPSRMTAGTLLELIAGKGAAEFGKSFDSSPFEFNDENPALDYFGKILEKAGFNYDGEDVLYCGTDGRMMSVQVYNGIIYYQRLRHMTADKWQVRSTGPMDTVTHQPIKGRKRGGAIRFGEMERDCLIAHGASFTLNDRILDCSDDTKEWVCCKCGGALSPLMTSPTHRNAGNAPECSICGPTADVKQIHMPYAFKFLIAELGSVGIRTKLEMTYTNEVICDNNGPAVHSQCL